MNQEEVSLGKEAAEFLAKNLEKILKVGKQAFGKLDENIRIEIKTAYTKYLITTAEKYSKSKSFFITDRPVDLYDYYVPIGIACANTEITEPTIETCINESTRIVITGTGGSGKSILVKHLFLDCIKSQKYTPILIELRDLNNEDKSLDDYTKETLDTYGFNISGDYIKKAKEAGGFCFFLDGYDEVNYSQREKLIKQIKSLSNNFPSCPIIISSRPEDDLNGIHDYSIFNILPLNLETASELIEKLPFDEIIKSKFTDDLASGLFEEHNSFLSNPLLLSIMLLTYGQNAEIPSKLSIFYDQAYQALFQRHDANKGGYNRNRKTTLDIQEFSRVFSLFSLQTYDKRLFKMPKTSCLSYIEKSRDALTKEFEAEAYLNDLLSAACLLIEDGLDIAFSHRSFQEYFVALHISKASPEIQKALIERYWANISTDSVITLLLEINPELVERLIFIPKLEELFSHIDVKREVGISHSAKYIKKVFSNIVYHPETIDIDINEKYFLNLHVVARRASEHYGCDAQIFLCSKKFDKKMYKTYGDHDHQLKDMTYKTPFLKDILDADQWFSTKNLQTVFKVYQELKKRHANKIKDLDELLGIK